MNQKGRISIIELLALIVIGVEMLYFLGNAFGWFNINVRSGLDKTHFTTCENVAKVNSLNGIQCPVDACGNSDGSCEHYLSGKYIGYYDSEHHTIIGNLPDGYNDSENPVIEGKEYIGQKDTMVLEVIVENGQIDIVWTGGAS